MASKHPTYDDGVTVAPDKKGVDVWMVKKNPGVYFRRPQEGKPLEFVDEEKARSAGFDVDAHRVKRKVADRLAAKRAEIEREVRREEILAELEEAPPFVMKHKGASVYTVVNANGVEQAEQKMSKAEAEELAALLNKAEVEKRLAEAGCPPTPAEVLGTGSGDEPVREASAESLPAS